mmetsp:Transcript_25888/g.48783  ORF Transcript_25888/g.48783 Transcript_25888/m.48783 type:complete len:244 (-) Transcript_25888:409-1140(-)
MFCAIEFGYRFQQQAIFDIIHLVVHQRRFDSVRNSAQDYPARVPVQSHRPAITCRHRTARFDVRVEVVRLEATENHVVSSTASDAHEIRVHRRIGHLHRDRRSLRIHLASRSHLHLGLESTSCLRSGIYTVVVVAWHDPVAAIVSVADPELQVAAANFEGDVEESVRRNQVSSAKFVALHLLVDSVDAPGGDSVRSRGRATGNDGQVARPNGGDLERRLIVNVVDSFDGDVVLAGSTRVHRVA